MELTASGASLSETNSCSSKLFVVYVANSHPHRIGSYVTQNAITDVNSAAANVGAAILLANIQDTQSMLTTMGVTIPVGNADAGSYFNDEVLAAVNYGVRLGVFFYQSISTDCVTDG